MCLCGSVEVVGSWAHFMDVALPGLKTVCLSARARNLPPLSTHSFLREVIAEMQPVANCVTEIDGEVNCQFRSHGYLTLAGHGNSEVHIELKVLLQSWVDTERVRRRAVQELAQVILGDQLHQHKPEQCSVSNVTDSPGRE